MATHVEHPMPARMPLDEAARNGFVFDGRPLLFAG